MPVTTLVRVDSSLPATIQSRKGNCGKCISPQLRRESCIAVAERTIHPSPAFFTRPNVVFRLRERQKIPTRWTGGGDCMQLHMRNVYTGSGKKVSLYITLISVTSTDRPPSSRLHPTRNKVRIWKNEYKTVDLTSAAHCTADSARVVMFPHFLLLRPNC